MKFTDALWQSIAPVYEAILRHPFVTGLSDGTLSRERFVFYMQQDALYLQDFARSLAMAGVRSPDVENLKSFLEFANGAIVVERALHESYFQEFQATADVPKAPACFAYAAHLVSAAATGSYAELTAALLPCFWIYREVGSEIYARAAGKLEGNPYARWVETYAGVAYDESVARAIAITDAIAADAGEQERARMQLAFDRSSRLEWMFWDSAYRLEQWPPA